MSIWNNSFIERFKSGIVIAAVMVMANTSGADIPYDIGPVRKLGKDRWGPFREWHIRIRLYRPIEEECVEGEPLGFKVTDYTSHGRYASAVAAERHIARLAGMGWGQFSRDFYESSQQLPEEERTILLESE